MKLSIITVVLNDPIGLYNTINSIKKIKNKNFEYIIIDGGSEKETISVIQGNRGYIDKCLSKKDKGIYYAMNNGIKLAENDLITFLNAGDTVSEDYVDNFIYNIDNSDYIYSGVNLIYSNGKKKKVIPKQIDDKSEYLQKMPFPHPGLAVKKNCFAELGKFDTKKKITADHQWIIRLLRSKKIGKRGKFANVYFQIGGQSNSYNAVFEMYQTALSFGRKPIVAVFFTIYNLIVTTYYKIQNHLN